MASETNDRMVKDVRERLKGIATKGGKYFTGTAKLFLHSTTETVSRDLPTLSGMIETNKDLMNDTVRFLRNPVDSVNRGIDRAMQTEGWKSLKKVAMNALDDLKTGNLYDAKRSRTEYGESVDSLMDSFGDFDMGGFDESGDYVEDFETPDIDADVALAEAHEEAEDTRTEAMLGAMEASTKAIVNTENSNAQLDIRASVKQHSQIMNSLENVVTQQAATLNAVNSMAQSILEVKREAHNEIMTQMKSITTLLTEIKTNTAPPEKSTPYTPKDPLEFLDYNGTVDIAGWLKSAYSKLDETYGISNMLGIGMVGNSISDLTEALMDNPLEMVTNSIVSKILENTGLQKALDQTSEYMKNFFPSLLDKFAEMGKRFELTPEEGGGNIKDLILGMFGIQNRPRTTIHTGVDDLSKETVITNRTTHAIEQVIPMWLSRIYSGITGEPIQLYNYSSGKLVSASDEYARQMHESNDVAGRMGSTMYTIQDVARSARFDKVEDQEKFMDWLYTFFNNNVKSGNFINPFKSDDEWRDMLPNRGFGENEALYSNFLRAYLQVMPRNQLMALSRENSDAREALNSAVTRLNESNRENGLTILHSGLLANSESKLRSEATKTWRGISQQDAEAIEKEEKARAVKSGTSYLSSNVAMNDILSVLKRGILTYTYIIGDNTTTSGTPQTGAIGTPSTMNPDVLTEVLSEANTERNRLGNIVAQQERVQNNIVEGRAQRQQRQDEEMARAPHQVEGLDSVVFHSNMSMEDIRAILQQVQVHETTPTTSDNPNVERGRSYISGYARSLRERLAPNPENSLIENIKNFLGTAPFELVKSGLQFADDMMFKLVFGEDAPTSEEPGEAQSLMHTLGETIKGFWHQASDWFSTNIGEPLKKFLLDEENGLLPRLRKELSDRILTPLTSAGKKAREGLIGTKVLDEAGNATGQYAGGKLSNLINRMKDRLGNLRSSLNGTNVNGQMSIFDRFLYGDEEGKRGKGRVQNLDMDIVDYDINGNPIYEYNGYRTEYHGFMGKLKQAGDKFSEMLFGPDANGDDHKSKEKAKFVKDELNKAAPDMMIGAGAMTAFNAGMGLLTGFALPGGPLVAPLLGAGIGFMTSSESFKHFLFGDQFEENQQHYDMKTGRMVTKKVKTRTGSDLISKEVYDKVKAVAPKVGIGAVAGAIAGGVGILPFGMGPLIGAALGSIGGFTAASDKLKKLIFGDADSEEGDDSGLISKNFRKKFLKVLKEHGGGAVIGKIAGSGAGIIASGILPGALGATLGPVLGTVGTVIGAISGPKIMEMLFGKEETETVVDANGQPTGEKIKKRIGGLFGKAFDGLKGATEKVAKGFNSVVSKMDNWFQESIIKPFSNALEPMKRAFTAAGNAVMDRVKSIASTIGDTIKAGFEKAFNSAVEVPLKDFFKEKILDPLSNAVSKVFSTVGKVIGNILSAPFKAIEYIFAGTIGGKTPDEARADRAARRQTEQNERQRAKLERRLAQSSRGARAQIPGRSILERLFSPGGGGAPVAEGGTPATTPVAEATTAVPPPTPPEGGANPVRPPKQHWWQRLFNRNQNVQQAPVPPPEAQPTVQQVVQVQGPPRPGFFDTVSDTVADRRAKRAAKKAEKDQKKRERDAERARKRQEKEARRNNKRNRGSPSGGLGSPTVVESGTSGTNTKPPESEPVGGSNDERDRLKNKNNAKVESNKENREKPLPPPSVPNNSEVENPPDNSKTKATDGDKEKRNKWRPTKSDNEYLADIEKHTRSIPKIFDEIKGQLGGSGWNIAYIKTLLAKVFGELKDTELPEEMEGSRRNVRKKRTIFGKIKDKVGGFFGSIKEGIGDKISKVIDVVTAPFKFVGSLLGKLKDGIANAGDVLIGTLKGLGPKLGEVFSFLASTLGTVISGAAEGIAGAFAGLGQFIYGAGQHLGDVLGNVVSTFTGVLSDGILGLSSLVLGTIQTATALFPDVVTTLWKGLKGAVTGLFKGAKFVFGGLGKGAKGAASGAKWLFGKIFGDKDDPKKKVRSIGTFKIDGGFIDNIKNPIPVYIVGREEGEAARAAGSENGEGVTSEGSTGTGSTGESSESSGETTNTATPAPDNTPHMGTEGMPSPPPAPGSPEAQQSSEGGTTEENTTSEEPTAEASGEQPAAPETPTEAPKDRQKKWRDRQLGRARASFDRAIGSFMSMGDRMDNLLPPPPGSEAATEGEPGSPQGANPPASPEGPGDEGRIEPGRPMYDTFDQLPEYYRPLVLREVANYVASGKELPEYVRTAGIPIVDEYVEEARARMAAQNGQEPPAPATETPETPTEANPNPNEGEPGRPQGATPSATSIVSSNQEASTTSQSTEASENNNEKDLESEQESKKAANDFKESYLDVDRVAEHAENPAEAYDQAVKHARSKEEIEAILASQQMNTNNKEVEVMSGGGGSSEDDESGGLFSSILDIFGGEGSTATKISKVIKAVGGTATGAAILGGLKTAGAVVGDASNIAATGYQLTSDKGNKLWGGEMLARSAISIGKVVTGEAAESTLKKEPIKKAIAKVIKSITENETVVKAFGTVAGKLKTVASKLTEKLSGTILDDALKKVGPKAASFAKQIGSFLTGGGLTIAFAVADFISGFGNAKKYFNVFGSDVTFAMRLTSGIVNTLGGLLSLIPGVGSVLSVVAAMFQDDIVQLVYNIIAGTAAQAELKADQEKLESATAAYNEENGTDLSVDEYSKSYNEDGTKKKGFFATIGSTIVNAFSKMNQSPLTLNETATTATDTSTETSTETGTGRRWGVGPSDTEETNETLNSLLTSTFSNSDNLTNAFINIGKGIGTSFVNMATSVFKDEKKGPTIFSIIGQGLGSSLLDDLKSTEGSKATINSAISTAMVATSTGTTTDSASATVKKTESNSTWSKIKSTVSSWLPWNWGKGPDEEGTTDQAWGTGPVKPMSQSSEKWNRGSNDMAKNGCGPTAAAMVASAYGDHKANPGEANKMSYGLGMRASDGGTNPKFFSQYANAHGYGMSEGPVSASKLSSNLKNGQPAVVMGKGGAFGNNTHYLVADRVNGSSVGLVDPINGSRKSSTMGDLLGKTSTAVYSYGKGPSEEETEADLQPSDETSDVNATDEEKNETDSVDTTSTTTTGDTTTTEEESNATQVAKAQEALVNKMKSVLGTLQYSLGSVQDPDKGVASCASTVGWAYRKVLGVDNMSASSTTQSTDNRFSTIWVNNGSPLDTSILQQGDILYQNWDQTKNTGAMKHTEMYAGNGQDISHGGGIGPKMKDLNDYRKKHTMMVRRYTPFVNEDDITILDSASAGTTTSADGTTSSDGSSSTGSSILDALSTMFSGLSTKIGNVLTMLLGGTVSEDSSTSDTSSDGTTTGTTLSTTSPETLSATEYKDKIWQYLRKDYGLTETGAAGLMGCWEEESSNRPDRLEGDYLSGWKSKYSNVAEVMASNANLNDYTQNYLFPALTRSGISYKPENYKSGGNYYPGTGLAQWTAGRSANLLAFANQNGLDWRTLDAQLKFFNKEVQESYPTLHGALNSASGVNESAKKALEIYEMSPSFVATKTGQEWLAKRQSHAQAIYNTYKGTKVTGDSYTPGVTESTTDTSTTAEPVTATAETTETGTGPDWGHGSDADLTYNQTSIMSEIRKRLDLISNRREEGESDATVTTIANSITDALSGTNSNSSDESTAILKTIATTLGTMVSLLDKISKNTENSGSNTSSSNSTSAINSKTSNIPASSPLYPTGEKSPDDVGLTIINRLTTV